MLRPQESQNHPVAHQLSGTPGTQLVRAPDKNILPFSFRVFLSVCVDSFISVCIGHFFVHLFVCLHVWTDSFGGWWLPFFPLCEMAAKKPSVRRALLQSLWPAARPEVLAGTSAGLAHKICSRGTKTARIGALRGRE